MSVGQDTRFELAPEVHTRDFDGELVILSLRGGDYFGVNDVGSRLWNALVAGKSVAEIAAEITGDYEVPADKLLDDLVALANELVGRGLLNVAQRT
jgi:hypothetical protein